MSETNGLAVWLGVEVKMVVLKVMRFGAMREFEFSSVREAARSAVIDVEENTAAPHSIEDSGDVVWTNEGPFGNSYDKLYALACVDFDA